MTDKTILYIEDNFHNRRIVRKILERQGYTIYEEEDGLEGFNKIRELMPPLVLLDISLPSMDGNEIAQKVKADDDLKHVILIALTASAMQGDRERFLAAGCDDYLSKPFRAVGLVEMVNHHFENLPEQPAKIEAPKDEKSFLDSEEQDDDDTLQMPVPNFENLDTTKTLGELHQFESLEEKKEVKAETPVDMSLDTEDIAAPVSEEPIEQETKQEELTEPVISVDMSLDTEDITAPVSEEPVEQETKQEELTEPVASVDMSLDTEAIAAPVSEEPVEQETKQEEITEPVISVDMSLDTEDIAAPVSEEIEEQAKEEPTDPAEAIVPIGTQTSLGGDTKPLNELETVAQEYLDSKEGVPTIKIHEEPKDLDRKIKKVTKPEAPEKAIKPKAKSKTKAKAKAKTSKAKTKAKPKTKAKAKAKTTKAKTKAKPKTKAKAKTEPTKAKTKVKPKTKAKAKTEPTKANDQGKKIQAEKAAPVQTSLKADDRTRPLWEPINTVAEKVQASINNISSLPSKPERKANETEGAPIEEITDNIVGMINSNTLKPVDPNGSTNGE